MRRLDAAFELPKCACGGVELRGWRPGGLARAGEEGGWGCQGSDRMDPAAWAAHACTRGRQYTGKANGDSSFRCGMLLLMALRR